MESHSYLAAIAVIFSQNDSVALGYLGPGRAGGGGAAGWRPARGRGRGARRHHPDRDDRRLAGLPLDVQAAEPRARGLRAATARRRGIGRARSHCRVVLPVIHFIPDLLTYSVPLFLKRQCDRTLGIGRGPRSRHEPAGRPDASRVRGAPRRGPPGRVFQRPRYGRRACGGDELHAARHGTLYGPIDS